MILGLRTHLSSRNPGSRLDGNNNTLYQCLDKVVASLVGQSGSGGTSLFAITDSLCHALLGSQIDGTAQQRKLFHDPTLQSHQTWLSLVVDRNCFSGNVCHVFGII